MENLEKNNELELDELEGVAGGRGGSAKKLQPKAGCKVYRIQSGDTLIKIANHHHTTAEHLKKMNPTIHDINDITAGRYIYVPS